MIRPVTLIAFAAFFGSGLYLYQVKHQAQLVDREIRRIREATGAARERAGVLRAEYALLNDPDRLAQLATAYVPDLKSTQPAQWSSMAEIDRRLPAVGGPTAEPGPLEPGAPAHSEPMAARSEPAAVARAEPAHAEPQRAEWNDAPAATTAARPVAPEPAMPQAGAAHPAEPAAPAHPAPASVAAAHPVAHTPTHAQPAQLARAALPAPVNLAHATQATPPTQLVPPPVQVAAAPLPPLRAAPSLLPRVSPPAGASVLAVASRPAAPADAYGPQPTTPGEAVARIARGAPVDPSVPVVASALGMARTMMTVTPVSPANASPLYPQATR
jgi:hypothetical protein